MNQIQPLASSASRGQPAQSSGRRVFGVGQRKGAAVCLVAICMRLSAFADDRAPWPQWRGPDLNGVSSAVRVPAQWSETQNILWKSPLPSWGGATPIVTQDCVFVTSPSSSSADAAAAEGTPGDGNAKAGDGNAKAGDAPVKRRLPGMMGGRDKPGGNQLLLLCFNRKDGSLRWQRVLSEGNRLYGKQNMSSPSPVTDGKTVWVMTGTGVLTAFDMSGEQQWRRDLNKDYGEISLMWGYAASPLLYEGRLIVPVLHTGSTQSYVASFDGKTGQTVWKVDRKTDAQKECPDAYTTPTLSRHAGRIDLVIAGADVVTGHDPATGEERWRATGLNPEKKGNYRIVASPVAVDGVIIAPTRVKPVLGIRAGGAGDVTESHVLWKYEKTGMPDVPTPACDGKYAYFVDDKGIVVCLNPATGEKVWGPERTSVGTVSASPVVADGKIFITNENATTTVLGAGPEYKVIGTNQLEDSYTISSMALCDGQIFIRTSANLYCIGEKPK